MRNTGSLALTLLMVTSMVANTARAHVVLTEPSAIPGARYVAHFKVGHGCSGSPTVQLTITIPASVASVAPEPADGWHVSSVREKGRVTAVTWKGGLLASDKPGMFTIAMTLPRTEGALAFPAVQTCQDAEEHWTDVGVDQSKRPAPLLRVARAGVSSLVVSEGWFRALPPPAPSGAYFIVRNTGEKPATLTSADSPACGSVMIHKSKLEGGVSSMMSMATVDVAPGAEVRFAPGGYHLMCMDARTAIKPGAHVPVTLNFKDAAPVTAQFEVRDISGK